VEALSGSYNGAVGDLGAMNPSTPTTTITDGFQRVDGSLALTLNPRGIFTARATVGGINYSGRGPLTEDNQIQADLRGPRGATLPIALQLVFDANTLAHYFRGTAADSPQLSALAGFSIFNGRNPLPNPGSFTLDLPVQVPAPANLNGTGAGTVILTAPGVARVAAFLPDGTRLAVSTPVWGTTGNPEDLVLLVSHPLYRRNGGIGGWINQDNTTTWTGLMDWTAPERAQGGTVLFPDGFAVTTGATMRSYTRPARGEALFTNWPENQGTLRLSGGGLPAPVTSALTLLPNNRLVQTTPGENGLAARIAVQLPRGTFSGTVRTEGMTRPARIQGVIDRANGSGVGYFLSTKGSGLIFIEP
jgi:hypothetical protein